MSTDLSPTEASELDEMLAEFGAAVGWPDVDPDMREVAGVAAHVRGLLAEATAREGMSISDIARRLNVSKSAVSRHLRSDGDIRISTAVLLARALGRHWTIDLVPGNATASPTANYRIIDPVSVSGPLPEPKITVTASS